MTMYIFLLFLTQIVHHSLYGACDNSQITFQLVFPDKTVVSQNWEISDFKKLRALNDALEDVGNPTEFTYQVKPDETYLSHEYFQNLITGNFINGSITRYINNYNFFIGSEVDIQLPYNKQYEPFPTSLKWKVFKDNEDFFRIVINNKDQKELQDSFKTFLCWGLNKNPLSLFNIQETELTLTQHAKKLSLNSPFIFDVQVLESIDKQERNLITWLDLSNSILFDLNLPLLKKYFPNLHKVSANNTFIKTINENDIEFLKEISNKEIIPDSQPDDPFPFFDGAGQEVLYAAFEKRNHGGKSNDEVKKMENYAHEINEHSFVLELNECLIQNSEAFLALQNTESHKKYAKSVCIKGIKINELSPFKKMIAQLVHKKRSFLKAFAITMINIIVVTTLFIKCKRLFVRALIGLYTFISLGSSCLLLHYLYKIACFIDPVGVVFRE